MKRRTDIVPENTAVLSLIFGIFMICIPFYLPLTFLITSVIELFKFLVGARQQYSILQGIIVCAGLSYLAPIYVMYKLLEFFETWDLKHLDFTRDIFKRPSYYYPIAFPFFLVNIVLMWPLYNNCIMYFLK